MKPMYIYSLYVDIYKQLPHGLRNSMLAPIVKQAEAVLCASAKRSVPGFRGGRFTDVVVDRGSLLSNFQYVRFILACSANGAALGKATDQASNIGIATIFKKLYLRSRDSRFIPIWKRRYSHLLSKFPVTLYPTKIVNCGWQFLVTSATLMLSLDWGKIYTVSLRTASKRVLQYSACAALFP